MRGKFMDTMRIPLWMLTQAMIDHRLFPQLETFSYSTEKGNLFKFRFSKDGENGREVVDIKVNPGD